MNNSDRQSPQGNPRLSNTRLPWSSKIGPSLFPRESTRLINHLLPMHFRASSEGSYLLAIETMVLIEAELDSLKKAGILPEDLMPVAYEHGFFLDLPRFEESKNYFFMQLLNGNIGGWEPEESHFPAYRKLRNELYRRPRKKETGNPQVAASGIANSKRLVYGKAADPRWDKEAILSISYIPRPLKKYSYASPANFAHQWWDRKTVSEKPVRHRSMAGNFIHVGKKNAL